MLDLGQRFQSQLAESGLLPANSRVLVAVSGGADSLALLLLLHDAAATLNLQLEAGHLDHALRAESAADADFVRETCRRLGIPLNCERRNVGDIARQEKGNLEEVARRERRDFLQAVARHRGCAFIALGHHRNDQAETFLLRLLRGAGTRGLAGMRPQAGKFVRPLLEFDRDELQAYLREKGQEWREDPSNADVGLTRNRVRHQLLPLLHQFNPQIDTRLSQLCAQLAADEAYWQAETGRLLAEHGKRTNDGLELPRDLLPKLPPAVAGRLVRATLQTVRGNLRRIEASHVASILKLAAGPAAQAELDLPECWVAVRYHRLFLRHRPWDIPAWQPLEVRAEGVYPLPDGRALRVALHDELVGQGRETAEFSAASVPFPLHIRTVQPGDRLVPSGMKGSKKLQDLFVDAKLTHEERAVAPLVVRDGEILWVVGMRRCRDYWPKGSGEKVLRLSVVPSAAEGVP